MTSCSTPSKRARSSVLRNTTYSLGTYVRLTETVRCSSISFASLRASSTGRTSERNTRPNVPSTRSASLLSRLRRTLMVAPALPGQNGLTRSEEAGAAAATMLVQPPTPSDTDRPPGGPQDERERARDDRSGDEAAGLRPGQRGLRRGGQAGRPGRGGDGVRRGAVAAHEPGQQRGRDGEGAGQGERPRVEQRRQHVVDGGPHVVLPAFRVREPGGRAAEQAPVEQGLGDDEPQRAEGAEPGAARQRPGLAGQ